MLHRITIWMGLRLTKARRQLRWRRPLYEHARQLIGRRWWNFEGSPMAYITSHAQARVLHTCRRERPVLRPATALRKD